MKGQAIMSKNRPNVGVGVFVCKDDKVLLGYRIASHGANCWGPPGGHLEFGESIEQCALRELQEETSLQANMPKIVGITNDIFTEAQKHYVTIFTQVEYGSGIIKNMEPDKCVEWRWFSWNALPEKLFLPMQNFLRTYNSPFLHQMHENQKNHFGMHY